MQGPQYLNDQMSATAKARSRAARERAEMQRYQAETDALYRRLEAMNPTPAPQHMTPPKPNPLRGGQEARARIVKALVG